MRQALRLAELLCARLCHELGAPLAALAAAQENTPGRTGAGTAGASAGAIGIADSDASALSARIHLLRAAWAGECGELGTAEIAALAAALPAWRRVALDVSELDRTTIFPPDAARLLLNLVLLGSESLPAGGTVMLSSSGRHDVLVEIHGPRAAWPSGLAAAILDEQAAWSALERAAVQLALTAMLARTGGFRLAILMSGAPVEIPPPLLLTLPPPRPH